MDTDWAGNEVCGEDFMAGTICSDTPDHDGPHSPTCQTCGGDWMNDTCGCYERCEACGDKSYDHHNEHVGGLCMDCAPDAICDVTDTLPATSRFYCHLAHAHPGDHVFTSDQICNEVMPNPVYDVHGNRLPPATCQRPAGHQDFHSAQVAPEPIERNLRRKKVEPVTQQEIYEVFGIQL